MERIIALEDIKSYLSDKYLIGGGHYGDVYKGTLEDGDVAIKAININDVSLPIIMREIQMMRFVDHVNIVAYVGYVIDLPHIYLLTDFIASSLHQAIHESSAQYTDEQGIKWLTQAAKGLDYLHNLYPMIVHGAVRPKNMLLDQQKQVLKLCDFGSKRRRKIFGSHRYMAPEIFQGAAVTDKCDVYSLGITIWEVLSRKKPYEDSTSNIMNLLRKVNKENLRPSLKYIAESPVRVENLIESCWSRLPANRPVMKAIMQSLYESTV